MDLLGLASCDTCRTARKALEASGRDVAFRDIRADPLPPAEIASLLAAHGDALLNRKSTTWRNLPEAERSEDPAALLARYPALMKRPVIREGGTSYLGWTAEVRAALGLD